MVDVVITNADGIGLNNAIGVTGSNKPSQIGASGQTDYAMYSYNDGDGEVPGSSNFTVQGRDFCYDSNGLLAGGTITSITIAYTVQGQYDGGESYSDFEIPVQSVVNFGRLGDGGQSGAMAILAGNDAISSNGFGAFAYGGNDTFTIVGTGSPFPTTGITQINGGSGANTAVFPYALREAATITGGGGTETVVQSGITANLVSIDKIQFIDGSTYEDTTTPGAQAALAFQGILGRQPDAINAGGYGQLAEQNGVATAATALLATPEGQADTASLSNADFVTRLYQNILDRAPDAQGAAGWQADLDSGSLDRGAVVADFASSPEAQQVNAA